MGAREPKGAAGDKTKPRASSVETTAARRIAELLAENERLREAVDALEREAKRYYERYVDAQVKGASVATLYVASSRLRASIVKSEVIAAIEEVVVGLVGSEEMILYETSDDGATLVATSYIGVDAAHAAPVHFGEGVIGRAAASGVTWIRADAAPEGQSDAAGDAPPDTSPGDAPTLTACVPLRIGHSTVGAIAIFEMLAHKRALEPVDRELFELLSTQAAMALLCSKLAARAARAHDSSPDATRARF